MCSYKVNSSRFGGSGSPNWCWAPCIKIAILILSLMFTLGILELAMRLSEYDINRDPNWRFDHQVGWVVDSDAAVIDSVQPTGFRHSPAGLRKPADVRRLLILGDSFALATGVPYARSFPGLLERRLNRGQSSCRWQVINLSVDDWGSAQQFIALKEYGLGYEPDVVVLQTFPFNDLCNNSIGLADTCSLQDSQRPYLVAEGGRLRARVLSPGLSRIRKTLRLWGWIENQIAQGPRWEFSPPRPDTGESSLRSEQDWRRRLESWGFSFFKENARRQGLEHPGAFYALMPETDQQSKVRQGWESTQLIFSEMDRILSARRIPFLALVIPFCATFDGYWRAFAQAADANIEPEYGTSRFEAIFRELGVPVISVRRRILTTGVEPHQFFLSSNDCHLSHYGHSQVVDWILRELERLGIVESLAASGD